MEKKGIYEWFKNPKEQNNIDNNSSTLEKGGKDDVLENDLELHELMTTGKKVGQEVVDYDFALEGILTEEKASDILKNIELEFNKIDFEFSQNKEQLMNLIKKESKFYDVCVKFDNKMLEEKNPALKDSLTKLRDVTFEAFERLEKTNEETRKILLQNEEVLKLRYSLLAQRNSAIKDVLSPVNPELN